MNVKGTLAFAAVAALCVGAASVVYMKWQDFAPVAGWMH